MRPPYFPTPRAYFENLGYKFKDDKEFVAWFAGNVKEAGEHAAAAAEAAVIAGQAAEAAGTEKATAAARAQDAEAWAAGTRGGEAVPEDDPAHNNNAAYYVGVMQRTARQVETRQTEIEGNVQELRTQLAAPFAIAESPDDMTNPALRYHYVGPTTTKNGTIFEHGAWYHQVDGNWAKGGNQVDPSLRLHKVAPESSAVGEALDLVKNGQCETTVWYTNESINFETGKTLASQIRCLSEAIPIRDARMAVEADSGYSIASRVAVYDRDMQYLGTDPDEDGAAYIRFVVFRDDNADITPDEVMDAVHVRFVSDLSVLSVQEKALENLREIEAIKALLNSGKTVRPGYVLVASMAGRGAVWAPMWDKTAINNAVSAWLADHPEATTTVVDGSITPDKLSPELAAGLRIVTPEMFGAVGDGVADDTAAIQTAAQAAAEQNARLVFTKPEYRTGTINIPGNCEIDCGLANFFVTNGSTVLFSASGEIEETGTNVTVQRGEAITAPNYSGVALIYSETDLLLTREYHKSGFVAEFVAGRSREPSAFDIPNAVMYAVTPITVIVRRVGNVAFEDDDVFSYILKIDYGRNCHISGWQTNAVAFCGVQLYRCIDTTMANCKIAKLDTTAHNARYSYTLSICESAHSKIVQCVLYNRLWHAATTSGLSNSVFSIFTSFWRCELLCPTDNMGYLDHDNGFFTSLHNCLVQCATLGAGGGAYNCTFLPAVTGRCFLSFNLCSIRGFDYTVRDAIFVCADDSAADGVGVFVNAVEGATRYGSVRIDGATLIGDETQKMTMRPRTNNTNFLVDSLSVRDAALDFDKITVAKLTCNNVGPHRSGDPCNIGSAGQQCDIAIADVVSSCVGGVYITGEATLTNCTSGSENLATAAGNIFLSSCRVNITQEEIASGRYQGVANQINGSNVPVQIYRVGNETLIYTPTASGYEVTKL